MKAPLLVEEKNGIGILTLNRPEVLNAINLEMRQKIVAALRQWEKDVAVKAVLLKSSQEKAFCAGGDIRQVAGLLKQDKYEEALEAFRLVYDMVHYIAHYPKPVISIMDGITMGGGVGIGAFASHRIITERTVLAMPEVMIGLIPDIGSSFLFQKAAGFMGLRAMLTGQRLRQDEIVAMGFADYEIPVSILESVLTQLDGDKIGQQLEPYKKDCTFDRDLLQQVQEIYGAPDVDSILVNLRKSPHEWAVRDLQAMMGASPFALRLTYRQWHAKVETIAAALRQDLTLVSHLIQRADFVEGVRAAVIDKDRSPRWHPAPVHGVELDACFA